jgi:phage major head subunit gpT-like protein
MPILTQQYLKGVNTLYNTYFKTALDGLGAAPALSSLICEETDAAGFASVEYNPLLGMPILKELAAGSEGEISNLATGNLPIANKVFQRLIELRKEDLDRGQAKLYLPMLKKTAAAYVMFKEQLLATKLVAGFSTEKSLCVGSPAFFSNSQVIAEGKPGTLSNAATKKLSAANFETAVENMRSRTDAEKNSLNLGSKLILVVGPRNEALGKQIVKLGKLANGGDNPDLGMADLFVWNYLAPIKPDAWFLFDIAYSKPVIYQTEVPLSNYMQTNPEDTNTMRTGKFLYQLYHRGNLALADPLVSYGSDGSTSA